MGTSETCWRSFKLTLMGDINIKLVLGKLWDDVKKLDGEGTCDGPLQVSLGCTSRTEAHLQS